MTLYSWSASNIRKTWLLLTGFLVFIIGLGWLFSFLFNDNLFLIIAVLFSVLSAFSSYWWSDKIVLKISGAQPLKKEQAPELYRIVENLCIASGLPMPRVYIIPQAQPNAFATGRDENHAVVAVTEGLLRKLERVELEGVIAHELSHIKNKDMLLQTMVVVLVGVVGFLSEQIFWRMAFWGTVGDRRESQGGTGILFLIAGAIAAILAPIAATLIQLAISRKREFLADASAALLTRYPEGLARALEKIASDPTPMKTAKNFTAHLYIVNPLRGKSSTGWFAKLFMTHPPVEERIKALRGMEV